MLESDHGFSFPVGNRSQRGQWCAAAHVELDKMEWGGSSANDHMVVSDASPMHVVQGKKEKKKRKKFHLKIYNCNHHEENVANVDLRLSEANKNVRAFCGRCDHLLRTTSEETINSKH
jgi:hypothetical protein